jgi:hypothetical protein
VRFIVPSSSRNLEKAVQQALTQASDRHQEYVILEHLLLARIDDNDAAAVVRACKARHRGEDRCCDLPAAWLLDRDGRATDRRRVAVRTVSRISSRTDLTLAHNDKGRPSFPGSGLPASMASSSRLLGFARAEQALAIDVERVLAIDPLPLAVFHGDEADTIGRRASSADLVALWTAKEAYVKVRGAGSRIGPESFVVRLRGDPAYVQHDARKHLTSGESHGNPRQHRARANPSREREHAGSDHRGSRQYSTARRNGVKPRAWPGSPTTSSTIGHHQAGGS